MTSSDFAIVGAGLAGCECALALARYGYSVTLFEQKPFARSAAHASDEVAELVCSNSLRSDDILSGIGLLKEEMRQLGSSFMKAADACKIPAGKALAVDRIAFSRHMASQIARQPLISLVHQQINDINSTILKESGPRGIIIAAGPMASETLFESLAGTAGSDNCYFYDAIAPIIWTESLNMKKVFRASRYDQEKGLPENTGDYLNCPMNREEYETFHAALCQGQTFAAREFEQEKHFEGCMPIETLATRGPRTLTFGPFKPVGFINPATGKRPWAVVQLRAENANMETCNMVGCQTKLLQSEQKRIFRLIPGMEHAEFARFGSMHRNAFVNAPEVLAEDLSLKNQPSIFLAGQITGVEGYVESAACGLWLGLALSARSMGHALVSPPQETALGALLAHLRQPARNFQPSNINFGLMPQLNTKAGKKARKELYSERARREFSAWQKNLPI